LLSDLAGARTGGKSGEEWWGLKHTTLVVSLTTQTKPPPTVAVPPKQRHLCALVCVSTRKEGRYSDEALF